MSAPRTNFEIAITLCPYFTGGGACKFKTQGLHCYYKPEARAEVMSCDYFEKHKEEWLENESLV